MSDASTANRVADMSSDAWTFGAPRPELAPRHEQRRDGDGPARLVLSGNGDRRAFGWWRADLELESGRWYEGSVLARVEQIENPNLSVFAQAAGHFLLPQQPWSAEPVRMSQRFRLGEHDLERRFELFFRASDRGSIEWSDPRLVAIDPPKHRCARVATIRFGPPRDTLTLESHRRRITEKLDQAGVLRPDIVVLPEFCPVVGVPEAQYGTWTDAAEPVPNGPTCRVLAEAARKYRMHVLCGLIEGRGRYVFNTAVLFDRQGQFIGQYDKTHLTFGELVSGFSCGEDYPLFDLDFGRIAVHICYDEWFPEVARYYAHQGAEILFLPVAGGKPITWRTRALDNGIHFVSASINPPSMIIESSGAILAETHSDGVVCADLNLDVRETNWYRDPTLTCGMPCIIPQMRHCLDNSLIVELNSAMKSASS